jgi:molybdopterin/thiamine biosynthesis adenylyltransferase/molybdopterin converting factor small subunit
MAKIEFVVPSVLNKGAGEKKISLEAGSLQDAFSKVSDEMGEDFRRRVFDFNGKPRPLINIYVNGKNTRFGGNGMTRSLVDGDSIHILPAVAGGAEISPEDRQRYSRQIMLEEIGFAGTERLRNAHVSVIGVGGIGNPVATQLTAMGIGRLKIIDRDVIEISNLHRQHLFTDEDIGKVKVEAALERLRMLNPQVEIEAVPSSVTAYTAEDLVKGSDVVIDALDSIDARYALNDACIKQKIPFIYAGALGMLGSVCTILPNKTACLRCMFPELEEDKMPTCSTEGVHPSLLYLVSGIQVSEAVKLITGQQPTLESTLLYIDLTNLSFEKIQMSRNENCTSCSSKEIEVTTLVAGSSQEITQRRGKLEDEVGRKKEENIRVQEQKQLIVEELCGRDMGKRTFTITPTHQLSSDSMDLAVIIRNAEVIGFRIKTKGNLGLTAISSETGKNSNNINSSTLSVSFLTSGAATIVGAKSEQEALAIYREFADGKRLS